MNRIKLNIKMDLLRVAKTALEVDKEFDQNLAAVFLNKAREEFEKLQDSEKNLVNELISYQKNMSSLNNDPEKRKKWGEKVLTVASRLSNR